MSVEAKIQELLVRANESKQLIEEKSLDEASETAVAADGKLTANTTKDVEIFHKLMTIDTHWVWTNEHKKYLGYYYQKIFSVSYHYLPYCLLYVDLTTTLFHNHI